MAVSQKRSRPITIDGKGYRWKITVDSGYSTLIVQAAEGAGQKLVVHGPVDLLLTPALVRNFIEQAMGKGWLPAKSGPEFRCHLLAGNIVPVAELQVKSTGAKPGRA
jgi:hypothetical protein